MADERVARAAGPVPAQATGTETADRVADVLLLVTEGAARVGVSEISRRLGLSKAVVHRILQSLVSRGFVQVDAATREYQPGPAAVALGIRALRDHDLRRAARAVLRRLRDTTRETTTLSELVGLSRVYLDQFESPQEIKMTVELGRQQPLYAGASSRAILAYLPAETQDRVVAAGLVALTQETVVDERRLRALLAQTRAERVASSLGERQWGAGSVASPVFGIDGDVVGAISVCGPVARFDADAIAQLAPLVRAAAHEVSERLGWDGRIPGDAPAAEAR